MGFTFFQFDKKKGKRFLIWFALLVFDKEKYNPIIYTKIVDSHIELYLRYLVHPKKARTVEDEIYEQILQKYKTGEIKLYKDSQINNYNNIEIK